MKTKLLFIYILFDYTLGFPQTCELINAKNIEYTINNTPYNYSVKKYNDRYSQTLSVGGKEYSTFFKCENDTFYFYKFDSPQYTINSTDTSAVAFCGVCKIPNSLKVGDVLPQYMDMSTSHYKHSEMGDAVKVSSYIIGNSYYGGYQVVTSEYHKAMVNSVFNGGFYTINFVNATVTGKEEYNFQGKKYTAYKITCENWSKAALSVASSADDEVVNKKYDKAAKKTNKKMEKASLQSGDNEQGYKVIPIEQWFVPELGFVKTYIYNVDKTLITTKMELKSINK